MPQLSYHADCTAEVTERFADESYLATRQVCHPVTRNLYSQCGFQIFLRSRGDFGCIALKREAIRSLVKTKVSKISLFRLELKHTVEIPG